jgi:aspartate kinase
MALIVQKYGGTSVGDPDRIRNVARRVVETARAGNQVAVTVSAMGGETDKLVELAHELGGSEPLAREYDALLSTGEQKSIALTDGAHLRARVSSIDTARLHRVLDAGAVAVIAGFQGFDDEGNITTLGRGGSDTTAVAVAAALEADVCEIYTDVSGIYTTDPNLVPDARKLDRVSFDEMIELASLGAKVLQIRSARFAMRYGVPLHVRSSFDQEEGTWVLFQV